MASVASMSRADHGVSAMPRASSLRGLLAARFSRCYTFVRTMVKKLSAVGNSLGIVIEKPILELLKIDRDTELEVTTDGDRLILQPIRDRRKPVLAASKRVMDAHRETCRKLAK